MTTQSASQFVAYAKRDCFSERAKLKGSTTTRMLRFLKLVSTRIDEEHDKVYYEKLLARVRKVVEGVRYSEKIEDCFEREAYNKLIDRFERKAKWKTRTKEEEAAQYRAQNTCQFCGRVGRTMMTSNCCTSCAYEASDNECDIAHFEAGL